jgi:undecaprenyl-phosphate galactose phosphotransferase
VSLKPKGENIMYAKYIKRILDLILSLMALIVLMPLMIIIGILVRINLGSPIIFKQKRPGKNEKIFTLYKFRTMTDKRDIDGNLLPDEYRLTKFGKFLRSTSLDELPELINIIKGDMAIVGPRPLLVEYLPYYTEEEKHRHDVRPGLTGLAQVNGRNLLEWDERLKKDLEYINSISVKNDLFIIFRTIINVIKRKDIAVGREHNMLSLNKEREYKYGNKKSIYR